MSSAHRVRSNFSEGTDIACMEAIVAAMRWMRVICSMVDGRGYIPLGSDGCRRAGRSLMKRRCARQAKQRRLSTDPQEGVHPRIGAADVIPFVPVKGIKLEQCVLLARQQASRSGGGSGFRCSSTRRPRCGRTG